MSSVKAAPDKARRDPAPPVKARRDSITNGLVLSTLPVMGAPEHKRRSKASHHGITVYFIIY